MTTALESTEAAVEDCAFVCLVVVGDASIWQRVHARFAAVARLISWASDRRRELLIDQVRRDWTKIDRHRPDPANWLRQTRPQVDPMAGPAEEVPSPSETELARLRENPLTADEGLPLAAVDTL